MIKKFGILPSVPPGYRSESEAHNEDVEQYIRRRYFEIRQQRGYAREQFIDRAANQEITIALAHELLVCAAATRCPNRRSRCQKSLARIWNFIGPPLRQRYRLRLASPGRQLQAGAI